MTQDDAVTLAQWLDDELGSSLYAAPERYPNGQWSVLICYRKDDVVLVEIDEGAVVESAQRLMVRRRREVRP